MANNSSTCYENIPAFDSPEWVEISRKDSVQTWQWSTDSNSGKNRVICKMIDAANDPQSVSSLIEEFDQTPSHEIEGVCFYDHVVRGNDSFQLMRPYCPGTSLAAHAKSDLSLQDCLTIATDLAGILQRLHEKKLYHKNLNARNVIVDSAGHLTLVDCRLDFARLCCSLDNLADLKQIATYSPEQLGIISSESTAATDLYSLGIILFELITGKHPYSDCDLDDILVRKMLPAPDRFRDQRGKVVPRAVCELISRLTFSCPTDRYQTAAAVCHDLQIVRNRLASTSSPSIALGTTDKRNSIIEPNFVGREAEVNRLVEELESGANGMAGFVAVEAVSGCGKSTLLNEYAALARQSGYWVINGIGQAEVASHSFQMLDGLIAEIGEQCRANPSFRDYLNLYLQDEIAILCEVLPNLAKTLGWTNEKRSGPEVFGHARGINAICRLLGLLGTPDRPCTIIFDDCQWIDESTVKLIEQWNRHRKNAVTGTRSVLMVLSFRHEDVLEDDALRQLDTTSHLNIDLFTNEEIFAVAKSMAGQLPEDVLQLVCKMAGGSPFMATAIIRGMLETGALEATDSGWQVNESAFDDLQSSNDAARLLAHRIDLLPARVQQFLANGAISGKVFQLGFIAKVLGQETIDLSEAINKNLIWLEEDGDTCHFVHDKIREELLERQEESERKKLHLRTAQLLEVQPNPSLIELAYHYDAAGEHVAALPYALESAEAARRQFSVDLAAKQYEIARRGCVNNRVTRFQIARGLGEVLMLGGKYARSAKHLDEAAELAENSFDRAQVLGKQGELAFKRGDMETATVKIEDSIRGLGAIVPRSGLVLGFMFVYEIVVQVLHTLLPAFFIQRKQRLPNEKEQLRLHLGSRHAAACWFARSKIRCMWTHFRTLNLAEEFLPCAEVAQAYSDHAPAMSLVPYPKRGIHYARCSLRIRRELQDTWGQGQSLHYYGIVLYAAGKFERCIETCRESVRLLEKTGDHWEMHMARYQIAASLYNLGRLDEARREARLLHESGLELGDQQASAISLDVIARCKMDALNLEVFERELRSDRFDSQGIAQLMLGKGVSQIAKGKLNEAVDTFKTALKNGRTSGIRSVYVLPTFAWLATALRCLAEQSATYNPGKTSRLVLESQKRARQLLLVSWPMKHSLPHALRELGLTSAMQGKHERAILYIKKAIKIARRLGMKHEVDLCRIAMQRVNPRRMDNQRVQDKIGTVANADRIFQSERQQLRPTNERNSLSLADRFNRIMSSGRNIASGLDEASILKRVEDAAIRLLRGQECFILKVDLHNSTPQFRIPGDLQILEKELTVALNAVQTGMATSLTSMSDRVNLGRNDRCSILASPILVRGNVHSCMLIVHRDVDQLFNATEEKLADFVTTIAGAALENADGFSQLQKLNDDLEKRVDERTLTLKERAQELGAANGQLKQIARDLTEAQKELTEAKERVEQSSSAKSEFLATMSHEIRTPMNAVMGMTELCMETELDENQRGYLEVVKSSAKSLLSLLNDILDLSKIEANKMVLESIPFEIRDVAESACDLLSISAFQKDLEIVCHVRPGVPDTVIGDPNRLQQIIINLVGNAIKFTSTGQITVNVDGEFDSNANSNSTDQSRLKVSVSDTGVGIPIEKQKLIFESFSQADSSTTREHGGTGLGLSICARFIKMMDGEIWVESQPGKGSTFHFQIDVGLPESGTIFEREPWLVGQRVWISSPNEAANQAYVDMLESRFNDVEVKIVPVETAVRELESAEPNCDILMTDLDQVYDGETLWQRISDNPVFNSMFVVGLFRKDRTQFLKKSANAGNLRTVSRPVRQSSVCYAIKSLCGLIESTVSSGASTKPGSGDADLPALRILLAEDVEINSQIATRFIERLGHNVTVAENGVKALLALEEQSFDAIFMDVEMPEMDGMETTREIREQESGDTRLPIVAMTAHAIPEIQERCLQAGMDDYITKPLEPERLQQVLEQIQKQIQKNVADRS